MIEEWRTIVGYEGQYEVSSYGRVRSLDRYDKMNRFWKGRILNLHTGTGGYLFVGLSSNGNEKNYLVHRLVAQAFIPNPNNLPQVNHKDENKANNAAENLEWCNKTYNENYGSKKEREIKTKTLNNRVNGHKKIIQYDLDNNFLKEWNSLTEASNILNISIGNISSVINGKRHQAGGYIWKAV